MSSINRKTQQEHSHRVNDALHHIHAHLADNLEIQSLSDLACYSLHHFQRVFKQQTGESVHDYIRRSRLEWAANLLIFNPSMSIMEVAQECGFQSNASFCHAFKKQLAYTPTSWRSDGYEHQQTQASQPVVSLPQSLHLEKVNIRMLSDTLVAYVRHVGYDRSIQQAWFKMQAWAQTQTVKPTQMIGLHHSNPSLIAAEKSRYVACLVIDETPRRDRRVGTMIIPGGLYACCRAQGKYGDLLLLMRYLYQQWLPNSHYCSLPIPAHTYYYKNHLADGSDNFDIEFRIPVQHLYPSDIRMHEHAF